MVPHQFSHIPLIRLDQLVLFQAAFASSSWPMPSSSYCALFHSLKLVLLGTTSFCSMFPSCRAILFEIRLDNSNSFVWTLPCAFLHRGTIETAAVISIMMKNNIPVRIFLRTRYALLSFSNHVTLPLPFLFCTISLHFQYETNMKADSFWKNVHLPYMVINIFCPCKKAGQFCPIPSLISLFHLHDRFRVSYPFCFKASTFYRNFLPFATPINNFTTPFLM